MAKELREVDLVSDIRACRNVLCPDHDAPRHLADFIDQHLVATGVIAITLRLPGKVYATPRTPLERRVYARLSALHSASDPYQTYSVDLAHRSEAPLFFAGELAISTSPANDCVGLVLAGHYQPQPGVEGVLFDLPSGRRIAQASAVDLLRSIATYIEIASARNEAAHAGKNAHGSRDAGYTRYITSPGASPSYGMGRGS